MLHLQCNILKADQQNFNIQQTSKMNTAQYFLGGHSIKFHSTV